VLLALEDGTPLRGDFVLGSIQRFDLTPIPGTLELRYRADSRVTGQLQPGSIVRAGSSKERYRIVRQDMATASAPQHGGESVEVVEAVAIPESFAGMALPLARAVVKYGKTLGEIYRACGATARVLADIPVASFGCYIGAYPSPAIAAALQQEGAAVVWSDGRGVSFKRLAELFSAEPVDRITDDSASLVRSPFLERHEIPWGFTVGSDGGAIFGRRDGAGRQPAYLPRATERQVVNLSSCLVVRRRVIGAYAGHIRAGDVVEVGGVKHVVVTAAHAATSGADGGASNQTTSLWLAQHHKG
jgi:hypothetical protein